MIRGRRIPGPELIVMGLLVAVCGLALAEVLSAEFGANSTGPPEALKTVTTPTADLGKLRETAVKTAPSHKARRHKRVHHAKKRHLAPAPAPRTVAQVETPATQQSSAQPYQQTAQPVQQLSAPSNPAPVSTAPKKTAPRPKPSGGGGSFDDSG
jgi:hypothetical protein